jgi:hypothetical protein
MNRMAQHSHLHSSMYIGIPVSINDLRDREFNGEKLTDEEYLALYNYDRFRLDELNAQPNDMAFHERYRQLQIMANLADWHDFLNPDQLKS